MDKVVQAAKSGNVAVLRGLLAHGGKADSYDGEKWYALHHAVLGNHIEVVNLLIANGANVNCRTNQQLTPLHIAAQNDQDILLTALIEAGADIQAQDSKGETPLHYAIASEARTCAGFLLEFGARTDVFDNSYFTPLHIAIQTQNIKIIKLLLSANADPGIIYNRRAPQNTVYWAPLHIAVQLNNMEIVNLLLESGADVNVRNKQRVTPLHIAAQYDVPNLVNVLIENHAEIDAQDVEQDIPLFLAIRSHQVANIDALCNEKTVLMENGMGQTSLHIACSYGFDDILRTLIFQIGEIKQKENKGEEQKLDELNIADVEGNTPLHCACIANSPECVKTLLEFGADPTKRNHKKSNDGMHYIAQAGVSPFVLSTGECTRAIRRFLAKRVSTGAKVGMTPRSKVIEKKSPLRSPASTRKTPTKSPKGSQTPAKSPKGETNNPTPKRVVSDTPYKDNKFKEEAQDFDHLSSQVSKAINETRVLLSDKLDKIATLINDLKNDFDHQEQEQQQEQQQEEEQQEQEQQQEPEQEQQQETTTQEQ